MTQNWRVPTDAEDYFLQRQKQLNIADRRPVIRRAGDLVGPGIGSGATRIIDFNDVLAMFNGFYSAAAGAYNAPPAPGAAQAFVGFVVSDASLGGVQEFYGLRDGILRRRVFTRSPADATSITWGEWATV